MIYHIITTASGYPYNILADGPYINFTLYVPWGLAAVIVVAGIIYAVKSLF